MNENPISVVLRIRPSQPEKQFSPNTIEIYESKTVVFDSGETKIPLGTKGKRRFKNKTYSFDRVFPEKSDSDQIYLDSVQPVVNEALLGRNATVFAYGATGSGKTHTMIGDSERGHGVIVQAMTNVLDEVKCSDAEKRTEIKVSYFEIYNEKVRDLLTKTKSNLKVLYGKNGNVVEGLTFHTPKSIEEVTRLLKIGNSRRSQSPTDRNKESSRSHAIFQVQITCTSEYNNIVKTSKLSLIDLAGSERASKSNNRGATLREGANINRSLLALGNCINALSRLHSMNKIRIRPSHINFRDSSLTRILRDSLIGNCLTLMIATVSQDYENLEDTANTLKYANNAKRIRIKSEINTSIKLACIKKHNTYSVDLQRNMEGLELLLENDKKMFSKSKDGHLLENIKKTEEKLKKLKNLQKSLYLHRRNKDKLDATIEKIEFELKYWENRKKKLQLLNTPMKVRNLKERLNQKNKEKRAISRRFNSDNILANNTRNAILKKLHEGNLKKSERDVKGNIYMNKVLSRMELIKWREREFGKLLSLQKGEFRLGFDSSVEERIDMSMAIEIASLVKLFIRRLGQNYKRFFTYTDWSKIVDAESVAKTLAIKYTMEDIYEGDSLEKGFQMFTPRKLQSKKRKINQYNNFTNKRLSLENKNSLIKNLFPSNTPNNDNGRFPIETEYKKDVETQKKSERRRSFGSFKLSPPRTRFIRKLSKEKRESIGKEPKINWFPRRIKNGVEYCLEYRENKEKKWKEIMMPRRVNR